jgi:CheY-like chemotaxis protein
MVRILVLMEDYSEMTQTRTLLKRVGCDVDAANSEVGLKEKVMTLKPDVLLVSGIGKKINPASVSKRLKEVAGFSGKIILILAPGVKISLNDLAENKFEAFLESPFDPMRLMSLITRFSNGKAPDLEEKFQKLVIEGALGQQNDIGSDRRIIKGNFSSSNNTNKGSPSPKDLKDRVAKYSQLVEGMSVSKTSTISKVTTRAIVKDLQKGWDRKSLDEIDEEKRKVARLLFKK